MCGFLSIYLIYLLSTLSYYLSDRYLCLSFYWSLYEMFSYTSLSISWVVVISSDVVFNLELLYQVVEVVLPILCFSTRLLGSTDCRRWLSPCRGWFSDPVTLLTVWNSCGNRLSLTLTYLLPTSTTRLFSPSSLGTYPDDSCSWRRTRDLWVPLPHSTCSLLTGW